MASAMTDVDRMKEEARKVRSIAESAEKQMREYIDSPEGEMEKNDDNNRDTLKAWVAEKTAAYDADHTFAHKKDLKYGDNYFPSVSISSYFPLIILYPQLCMPVTGSYIAWLEFTAANKLLAHQRKRLEAAEDGIAGTKLNEDGLGMTASRRFRQHDLVFAETLPQCLPGAPTLSVVKHSCKPNVAVWSISPVVDINGTSLGDKSEYIALRPIKIGEAIVVDHLGLSIKPRGVRRVMLKEQGYLQGYFTTPHRHSPPCISLTLTPITGDTSCSCERCTGLDLEGALVCPKCLPFEQRDDGFCLPEEVVQASMAGAEAAPGHVCEAWSPEGYDRANWHCEKCQLDVTRKDLDVMMPPGAPAERYLGLSDYAISLFKNLDGADPASIPTEQREQMRQAVIMTVGTKHWAAQADLLMSLDSDDASEVEVALGLLSAWIEDWLSLDPALYMKPDKVLRAAGILELGGKKSTALYHYEKVAAVVPTWSQMYVDASAAIDRCKVKKGSACC